MLSPYRSTYRNRPAGATPLESAAIEAGEAEAKAAADQARQEQRISDKLVVIEKRSQKRKATTLARASAKDLSVNIFKNQLFSTKPKQRTFSAPDVPLKPGPKPIPKGLRRFKYTTELLRRIHETAAQPNRRPGRPKSSEPCS